MEHDSVASKNEALRGIDSGLGIKDEHHLRKFPLSCRSRAVLNSLRLGEDSDGNW